MVGLLIFSQKLVAPVLRFHTNVCLLIIGVLICSLGLIIWIYGIYLMRRAFFDKTLFTTGPFTFVRHPMYSAIYIMLTGMGIFFFSYLWFLIMLSFIPIWYVNCRLEEKQMTEIHGKKYLEYKKKTGMFFPKFHDIDVLKLLNLI